MLQNYVISVKSNWANSSESYNLEKLLISSPVNSGRQGNCHLLNLFHYDCLLFNAKFLLLILCFAFTRVIYDYLSFVFCVLVTVTVERPLNIFIILLDIQIKVFKIAPQKPDSCFICKQ